MGFIVLLVCYLRLCFGGVPFCFPAARRSVGIRSARRSARHDERIRARLQRSEVPCHKDTFLFALYPPDFGICRGFRIFVLRPGRNVRRTTSAEGAQEGVSSVSVRDVVITLFDLVHESIADQWKPSPRRKYLHRAE